MTSTCHLQRRATSLTAVHLVLVRRSRAHMKPTFLQVLSLLTASAFAGARTAKPKSVTIVDVPSERRDYGTNIGNIKVRFSDGHSEVWTSLGRCMKNGL